MILLIISLIPTCFNVTSPNIDIVPVYLWNGTQELRLHHPPRSQVCQRPVTRRSQNKAYFSFILVNDFFFKFILNSSENILWPESVTKPYRKIASMLLVRGEITEVGKKYYFQTIRFSGCLIRRLEIVQLRSCRELRL